MPRSGKPGEIEVLSMFASVLRKAGIPFERDDPYIEFNYKGRKWRVQHFHPRKKGVTIKGKEHNMDLVIWSNNNYVAYVEVKDHYKDLPPKLSREFVGRVLLKDVDDALFISKKSTINRWQILDRYGIRNTNHILQGKHAGVEYREWPELVVENFIKNDLGKCGVKSAIGKVLPFRKDRIIELLRRHPAFNGVGFKFVENLGGKTKYYYISDEDYVIHAIYAIFIKDSRIFTVFKTDKPLNLANVYEAYGSSKDLGTDVTIYSCPEFETPSARNLFNEIGFLQMSEFDVGSQFGVNIDALPVYKWGKSTTYPLSDLANATLKDMPPCVKKALEGVPDGLFETAIFLQTVFKACSMPFNGKEFSEKCWMKVEEFWLGYEPSKTKKDAFEKVRGGRDIVLGREVDPADIPCDIDSSGIKGSKALDKLFHLELCAPNEICNNVQRQQVYEYIRYRLIATK